MYRDARICVLALSLTLIAGCGALGGYGPLTDLSRFESAWATPDGTRGVFTYHRYAYRPADGWRAFPDGGIPDYVHDESVVGIYDFSDNTYRIVSREKNGLWTDGQGVPRVGQITDGCALIVRGGQLRDDLARTQTDFMLLDLDSGNITALPLMRELDDMGLEFGSMSLADDDGTLVFLTLPVDAAAASPGWQRDESVPKEIWVRHPDSGYEKVADAIHYYAYTGGVVHYYSGGREGYMTYDTVTGRRAPGGKYPPSRPEITAGLSVDTGSPNTLRVGVAGPDGWTYRDTGIDPAGFF